MITHCIKRSGFLLSNFLWRSLAFACLAMKLLGCPVANAADCIIPVALSVPAGPLFSGTPLVLHAYPSNVNHIVSVSVDVDTHAMVSPDAGRFIDGSLSLIPGTDSHADVILDPNAPDFQFVSVRVEDNQKNCGITRARVKIRSTDSVAVVVGVDRKSPDGTESLEYAQADALGIVNHLVEALQLRPSNIWLLTNDPDKVKPDYAVNVRPINTPDSISTTIGEAAKRTDKGSKFYFYFSGHQFVHRKSSDDDKKPNYYFVLPNSTPNDFGLSSMYSWESLKNDLNELKKRVVIAILDSCYSGSSSAGYSPGSDTGKEIGRMKRMSLPGTDALPEKQLLGTNALLTSSSGDEPSWEFKNLGHGVFTSFLIKIDDLARAGAMDLPLHQMFYEIELKDVKGKGVKGMTASYDPGSKDIGYQQTPFASIDSDAEETLWAHFKKP